MIMHTAWFSDPRRDQVLHGFVMGCAVSIRYQHGHVIPEKKLKGLIC